MSITSKFGGTSLADAAQIRKVANIIRADPRRRFIVLSAPGKRCRDDRKVTDLLYLSQSLARQGNLFAAAEAYTLVRKRYQETAWDLGVERMEEWLSEVEVGIANGLGLDWVVSRGEYLNSRLIADYLGAEFVDAAETIQFGSNGQVLSQETDRALKARLSGGGLFVVPGFYGGDLSGHVRCFSRGGSDITGALVARATASGVYENWTDVSGLLLADPRVIDHPPPVTEVTYREQRELSYRGATVLHDEAVFPVLEAGIPIQIRNTNDPSAPGTRVVTTRDISHAPLAGIAGRIGYSALLLQRSQTDTEPGFARTLLAILDKHQIRYDHTPSGSDTVSLLVRDEEFDTQKDRILREIADTLRPACIDLSRGYALIAIVGEGLFGSIGLTARILTALADAAIPLCLVSQGLSEIKLIVGVADSDYERALMAIYHTLLQSKAPAFART